MNAFYQWLNLLVNNSKNDFAVWPEINWINPYSSEGFQVQRDDLLRKIEKSILFKDTKPYYNHISKGCRICGLGKWSCLFITGRCNANCFYCPAPQDYDETPSTQGLNFNDPTDYANYVRFFGFEGVSFSGGEPLLYFDRTLDYLQKVRTICKDNVYTWMYTNGILADPAKLSLLASAGLDEIRFDTGATGFNLDKIKFSQGKIHNITIEIPAIPEKKDKLIKLLPEMVRLGVTNLNLHQLRLTKHNAKNLVKRGYTILSAEKPIVIESELAALEIMNYAKENSIEIGINYCSFFFKHRFQKGGFRKQIAGKLSQDKNAVTQNGYLRELNSKSIAYKTIRLYSDNPDQRDKKTLDIRGRQYYFSEELVFNKTNLSHKDLLNINHLIEHEPDEIPDDSLLFAVWQLEYIEKELRNY